MFISFEGMDGSGKTTLLKELEKFFKINYPSLEIVFTREPGGKNILEAEKIRNFILDNENNFDNMSEALLYLVSRRIHLERIIWPALKQNKIVICDRFIDSSLAYQGYARDIGIEEIKTLNEIVTKKTWPDLSFFIDISTECAFKRMEEQNRNLDRIENENKEFFQKVHEGYKKVLLLDKKRFIVINGEQEKEAVFQQVKSILLKKLKLI